MHKRALIILLFSLLMASCANMGQFKYIMKPVDISKEQLEEQPPQITEKYQFKVVTVKALSDQRVEIATMVDELFSEYSHCMDVTDNGDAVRKFLIAVVNGTFRCNYHYGMCNGEYDPQNLLIIVSYKAFKRRGTLLFYSTNGLMHTELWLQIIVI